MHSEIETDSTDKENKLMVIKGERQIRRGE